MCFISGFWFCMHFRPQYSYLLTVVLIMFLYSLSCISFVCNANVCRLPQLPNIFHRPIGSTNMENVNSIILLRTISIMGVHWIKNLRLDSRNSKQLSEVHLVYETAFGAASLTVYTWIYPKSRSFFSDVAIHQKAENHLLPISPSRGQKMSVKSLAARLPRANIRTYSWREAHARGL